MEKNVENIGEMNINLDYENRDWEKKERFEVFYICGIQKITEIDRM